MKILHIDDFFHPEAGYQINLLPKYMAKLGHEVLIYTSEMENVSEKLVAFFGKSDIPLKDSVYTSNYGVKITRFPLKRYIANRAYLSKEIFKKIDIDKPDIIFIHGNDTLTGMRMLLKYKHYKIPYIMDSHMLEMASTSRLNLLFRLLYKTIFTPIILKNKIYVIRTQNDTYVERCLGIPLNQAPWISVGSDILLFKPDNILRSMCRRSLGIPNDAFVIVYAGKLDKAKGGLFLAESVLEPFSSCKDIVFLIIGNTVGEYGETVEKTFSESKNRIIRLPSQKYIDLAKFYSASDLAVFPAQCSLSFYDAQACGLPVLSENNNINIDRCSHNNGANFVAGDIKSFREGICNFLSMSDEELKSIRNNARSYVENSYNYEKIVDEYMRYINLSVIEQFR